MAAFSRVDTEFPLWFLNSLQVHEEITGFSICKEKEKNNVSFKFDSEILKDYTLQKFIPLRHQILHKISF